VLENNDRTGICLPRKTAVSLAWVSGISLVITVAGMIHASMLLPKSPRYDPAAEEMTRMDHLKEKLKAYPEDKILKRQFRETDLEYRRDTWQLHRFLSTGAVITVTAALAFLSSLLIIRSCNAAGPQPPLKPGSPESFKRRVNISAGGMIAGIAAMVAISSAVAGTAWWLNRPIPPPPEPAIEAYWPAFRGADGSGATDMAVTFKNFDGEIKFDSHQEGWISRIRHRGKSSPIIYGNHLFTTGGSSTFRVVIARSAATGRIKWTTSIPLPPPEKVTRIDLKEAGYAPATPCTDGERVYAVFSMGTLCAVDFKGKIAWKRYLGPLENSYGHASSLRIADNKLMVQLDQKLRMDNAGNDVYRSRLIAMDPATGRTLWEAPRRVPDTWSSPVCVESKSGPLVITATNPWVIANDAGCGKEVWRANILEDEVGPSPVSDGIRVCIAMQQVGAASVRLGGNGDVTKTHVEWQNRNTVKPDTVSPALAGEYLFLVSGSILECLEKETGKSLWTRQLGKSGFNASPAPLGGNRLLLVDKQGVIYIIEAGPQFRLCEKFSLGEGVDASAAFGAGRIFIKGRRHIFCFRASEKQAKKGP